MHWKVYALSSTRPINYNILWSCLLIVSSSNYVHIIINFCFIAIYLDKNDAVTTSALQWCLQSSYTPSPKVIDLFEVWDAKQGFSKYIDDIRYHTQPRHFRFLLVDGRVEMKYKHWCGDEV